MTQRRVLSLSLALGALCAVPASADVRIPKPIVRRTDRKAAAPPQAARRPPAKLPVATSPSARLPLWSSSFVREGVAYPYTMVGSDPVANPGTTTVRALIVPIRFTFAVQGDLPQTVFDAGVDILDGRTPIDGTLASPLFTPYSFTIGGQNVGTTQLADAYVRANFWTQITPAHDVHFLLSPQVTETQTIAVPAEDAWEGCDGDLDEVTWTCHGVWRPFVPIDFLNAQVSTLLETIGSTPDVVPIFVIGTMGTVEGPLGAHWSSGEQTWMWASYLAHDQFGGTYPDVSVLGHEILEWLNDPFASNEVPGWSQGPVLFTDLCYARTLEVADPLENNPTTAAIPFSVSGFTYHLPDATFIDFFSHKRSRSAGGLYSLFGGAPGPSPACIGDAVYRTEHIAVPGALATVPNGINDNGDVVGYYFDENVQIRGFVRQQARVATIDIPGAVLTLPAAINDLGQIAGFFIAGGRNHGFIRNGLTLQTLDVPGAIHTLALNLNRFGDVVGEYVNALGVTHGFVYHNGAFATIDAPGSAGTVVTGINDAGNLSLLALDAVGNVVDSYRRLEGSFSPVRFPGNATPVQVSAIDNQDRVAGIFVNDFFSTVDGFVTRTDESFLRMPLTFQINGMNSTGDVVGARDGYGFIATFTPGRGTR